MKCETNELHNSLTYHCLDLIFHVNLLKCLKLDLLPNNIVVELRLHYSDNWIISLPRHNNIIIYWKGLKGEDIVTRSIKSDCSKVLHDELMCILPSVALLLKFCIPLNPPSLLWAVWVIVRDVGLSWTGLDLLRTEVKRSQSSCLGSFVCRRSDQTWIRSLDETMESLSIFALRRRLGEPINPIWNWEAELWVDVSLRSLPSLCPNV